MDKMKHIDYRLNDYGILCTYRGSSSSFYHQSNGSASSRGSSGGTSNHHHNNNNNNLTHHRHQQNQGQDRQARSVYLALNDSNFTKSNGNFDLSSSNNNNGPPSLAETSPASNSTTSSSFMYLNDQPPILDQCCACDEAKYELVFEGLWSRYTHPDDFPENYWLAYFSDIIGASHSNEFRMWNQDSFATEGVKELAETGSTKKLESELKQVSSKTRTIIKARELRHPTLNSKTSAVFRTDRQHHLVSILSKLAPSPDWMVGVSGLELCQPDCSWATQRVVNLYLWDAGTDSGTTFTSPDQATHPQEKIHPFRKQAAKVNNNITSQRPTMDMSTFQASNYDPSNYQRRMYEQPQGGTTNYSSNQYDSSQSGSSDSSFPPASSSSSSASNAAEQTKPFARVTITRQRIYEKSCNGDSIGSQSNSNLGSSNKHSSLSPAMNSDAWLEPARPNYSDCRFTEWSDWSTCSSTCGKGIRTRTRGFVDEHAHQVGCSQVDLIEKEVCLSECIGNTNCVTRDWSEWSKCSVSCGQGYRKRTRSPIEPMKKACESVDLAEIEPCIGPQNMNCSAEPTTCEVSDWSQWSECSVACGRGTKIRTRQYLRKESIENCTARLIQKQSCTGRSESCKQSSKDVLNICTKPIDPGPCKADIERWHYDKSRGMCEKFSYGGCLGNANNFECFQDCERICLLPIKNLSPPS